AAVEVHVKLGRVIFQRDQTLIAAERCQRAIGVDGRIRQTRGAVASNTVPVEGVKTKVEMLGYGDAGVSSDAAAILRGVKSSESRVSDAGAQGVGARLDAGINAVAVPAQDAEDFIVAEARFVGRL